MFLQIENEKCKEAYIIHTIIPQIDTYKYIIYISRNTFLPNTMIIITITSRNPSISIKLYENYFSQVH